MKPEERQREAEARQEENAEAGVPQVSRRQFTRDALLRVGWAVPLTMAIGSGARAADPASAAHYDHGDSHHGDHVDTNHTDGDRHTDMVAGRQGRDPVLGHVDTHGDRGHIDGHTDTHSDTDSPIHIDKHYDKHFDAPHLDRHGDS